MTCTSINLNKFRSLLTSFLEASLILLFLNMIQAHYELSSQIITQSPSTCKTSTEISKFPKIKDECYKTEIVWTNVIVFSLLHLSALHGLYLIVVEKKFLVLLYAFLYCAAHAQGITAGAHRLWSHRSYKVKLPLKVLLVFLQTASFQNSVFVWVRDHRLHHKYTDTDADPHNAKRGFFFSHMGWLFVRKHPEVLKKGKCIDMTDITTDPVLMWQHKYYHSLMLICAFIIPVFGTSYLTGETLSTCMAISGSFRYIYSVHMTWLVNSLAHIIGTKPYDRNIGPVENMVVSHLTCGEGFHNFHHVFPWDYKAAELGNYTFNMTLLSINLFAKFGLVYDRKTVSVELIRQRALRTGDGNWQRNRKLNDVKEKVDNVSYNDELIWGWNDPNMSLEDRKLAHLIN